MCHGETCKYKGLANRFSLIPKRMIKLCNVDITNLSEFLLHEFCHEEVFNIKKAAFFIDNPDFDMILGVAGFERNESYKKPQSSHWEQPNEFSTHMKTAQFNNKVKTCCSSCKSVKKNDGSYVSFVQDHAKMLDFKNPQVCTWDLKHYNNGIIVFELDNEPDDSFKDHFENMLYMLSFCPVV